MQRNHYWLILSLALTTTMLLSACASGTSSTSSATKPVKVEKVDGSPVSRIILTDQGAKRLDLRTEEIRDIQEGGAARRAMPYAAIVYDLKGAAWAYTATEPLTYVRQGVTVDTIKGNVAYLKDGPPPGTQVVTVGVAELYGAEFGVGK
jgi:hypothetical protein